MRVPWTHEDVRLLKWWRTQGVKASTIARRLNRSVSSVRSKLSKIGDVREPAKRKKLKAGQLTRKVKSLLNKGMRITEIVYELNRSQSTVSKAARAAGFPVEFTQAGKGKFAWKTRAMDIVRLETKVRERNS